MADLGPEELDVIGVGNALVDVLCHESEAFLERQGLVKGAMQLVDEARAREIYDAMGPAVEISGGSAANTIVGVASFGGRAHYVGKVRNDQLGEVFAHDLRSVGVRYTTAMATSGPATGRCLIVMTPDAQRTMSTYLGASTLLGAADVEAETEQAEDHQGRPDDEPVRPVAAGRLGTEQVAADDVAPARGVHAGNLAR